MAHSNNHTQAFSTPTAEYPPCPMTATRREREWYNHTKKMWFQWGHRLIPQEKALWENAVRLLRHSEARGPWHCHALGQVGQITLTWTHWTFLKVVFGLTQMLRSPAAIWIQTKYPEANIAIWALNSDGPTRDKRFQSSRSFYELPNKIIKKIQGGETPPEPQPEVKFEVNVIESDGNSSSNESESSEWTNSENEDGDIAHPSVSQPQENSAPLPDPNREQTAKATHVFPLLSRMLEILKGEESVGIIRPSSDEDPGSDEMISTLTLILCNLRTKENQQMRAELKLLKRELSEANDRIKALEEARHRQDQERATLRDAITMAMGNAT